MGWATHLIARLEKGESVTFRPRGRSMEPLIYSGDECTVEPLSEGQVIRNDDIVLCKCSGGEYLHKIVDIRSSENISFFQIGNNKGFKNGWIPRRQIFGKLTKVEHEPRATDGNPRDAGEQPSGVYIR